MITNKAPLYSNREAIEDFKTLVNTHMDAHRSWQNIFSNKLNNEGQKT